MPPSLDAGKTEDGVLVLVVVKPAVCVEPLMLATPAVAASLREFKRECGDIPRRISVQQISRATAA